ncbi:helix-turn-helix domain-containing protein [Streptomyces sp. KR55]|uniref:helix-turn-helix domain-containing protein n=1 Tax=Streptomyces sp. KR55 TaxID=3457425 RepID=UPI003FD380D7
MLAWRFGWCAPDPAWVRCCTVRSRPTAEGRGLRAHIEVRTDALAVRPYRALTQTEAAQLLGLLSLLADQVLTSGTIPFPNPMGLPARQART